MAAPAKSPHPLLEDPWIAAQIDAAVAPYAKTVSASQLAWMRERLADTLASDPDAAKILRRSHPHPVESSGEVAADPALDAPGEKVKAGRRA